MKKRVIITTLAAALAVAGCNSGNSTQSSGATSTVSSSKAATATTSNTLPTSSFYKPDGTWTGAYFTNWNQWRNSAVAGEALGSTKHLDIFDQKAPSYISYAFFGPKLSTDTSSTVGYGGGSIGSGWASQPNGTVGDLDNAYEADKAKANYAELKKFKAKNTGTLLIASIGGWSYTARWSQFAKDANYDVNSPAAQAFIDSCEKLLRGTLTLQDGATYPVFDGINIDWEYPGYGHLAKPQSQFAQEPQFFEALSKALRVRIDQIKAETGYTKVLTVALPVVPAKMTGNNAIKWSDLANTFDWIDLMGLDVHGEFDAADANLMTPMDQAPASEMISSINYLIDSGVDPNRIVLGLPTYTRQMLVNNKPSAANNYGYGDKGSMNPTTIGLEAYKPMLFTDAPNAEDYYPAGGMVDNTGVYSYNCMLKKQNQLSANYCPAPASLPNTTDNRGLFGQPLPPNVYFTTIPGSAADLYIDHAWAYDDGYNVVKSPANGKEVSIPNTKYNAYSVFSYDTPAIVEQKATKLVKPYKLGGMWFWDVHNDAYKTADASKSLYIAATTALGTNTQPNGAADLGPCGGLDLWSASTAYQSGAIVYKDTTTYKANYWSQNSDPASHSGAYQEWTKTGSCPTTTPVPSPTPSATPSPKPTVSPSPSPVPSPTPSVVPSPSPSPVPTVSPSPVPTQSPTPAPAKTGTVTITMPTVVSAYNGNLQVQLLNSKDSNAVVATYTVKQGASVTSGNLPISDSTHAYKVKLVSGIADPLNGVNYIESGTPAVAVKNGQNTAMSIPMKASTTTKRTVTLAISGLQGSDKANISFSDANGKYSYTGYSGYGNGNAVFKIENNQNLTITVATAGGSYQSSSLSNSSTISKNQTIAMAFTAKVQPSPSPVPTVAPSPSPVPSPSPSPSVVPSPSPSPIASPTPAPSPAAYPTYPNGLGSYQAGNRVYGTNGRLYECKAWPYTAWCNGASSYYAPGSGLAWDQAWTQVQ